MSQYDLASYEVVANPFPVFAALRQEHPVYKSPDQPNSWVLLGYEEVATYLKDSRLLSYPFKADMFPEPIQKQAAYLFEALSTWLFFMNPPEHMRVRSLVVKAFKPSLIANMKPAIQRIADELIDTVYASGQMDMVDDFAAVLPILVISEMLGVDRKDRKQLKAWSDEIALIGHGKYDLETLLRLQHGLKQLDNYIRDLIEARRQDPQDDFISNMIKVEENGETLSMAEMLSLCSFVLFAGHETTTYLITNGIRALINYPEQRQLLLDNPDLIEVAVEEILRYDSPTQYSGRFTAAPLNIRGKQIEAGSMMLFALGSANRDPAQFENPDQFDIRRSNSQQHLAFGLGPHFCVGAALARLEGQIALQTCLKRLPNMRLANETITWRHNRAIHGPLNMPILFDPVA